jgi:predicted transcriptional regulator
MTKKEIEKIKNIIFDVQMSSRRLLIQANDKLIKAERARIIHQTADGLLSGEEAIAESDKIEKLLNEVKEEFTSEQRDEDWKHWTQEY